MNSQETLQALIEQNQGEVNRLLKSYTIKHKTGIAGVMEGYQRFGSRFMNDFLAIVQPGSIANYTPWDDTQTGPPPPPDLTGTGTSNGNSTSFWGTLDKIFGYANQASGIYSSIKNQPGSTTDRKSVV